MTSSACTCAACRAAAGTPRPVANRPGLPSIAYRSGTHGDVLDAMVASLSSSERHALQRLRTRDADDPSIALLDAFAVACDILTFYTERLANEAYLGTAVERASLQELGALVAYRLGRGAAAETWLAFSLERPPAPPPAGMDDPGVVPPAVPQRLELPVGLRVKSVPGPGEAPQTFETVEAIDARPEWNALPVVRTAPWPVDPTPTDAWIEGTGHAIARGDVILITGGELGSEWDIRTLVEVTTDDAAGRTRLAWAEPVGAAVPPFLPIDDLELHVFRKRLAVFGHNAPMWRTMSDEFQNAYEADSADDPEWPDFDAVAVSGSTTTVDVDGAHPDVVTDRWLVLDSAATNGRFRVTGRREESHAEFGISGTVTRLTLAGPDSGGFGTPRQVKVLAVPERLDLAEVPDDSLLAGTTLVVDGDASGMVAGRTVVLAGTDSDGEPVAEALEVDSAAPLADGRTTIAFTTAPQHPPTRATAVVFGNVARATHGETVAQLLGSGDARVPFAAFPLSQGPLTFVPADDPRGVASTLEVRVDDVRWREVPTTAISGPDERVYSTRDDPGGGLSVVFGDGAHGARPPSGSNNLRARYRVGAGAAGNLDRDTLSQAIDRPLGLKGVTNPSPATGGVDPEDGTHARRSIPIPVRTLGRAVSLRDYADFALAYTGIGRAEATVLSVRDAPMIVVTVADEHGEAPPESTVERLVDELRRQGDPRVRVAVVPCRPAPFRLALKVATDPDREAERVLADVETALRAAYAAPAGDLGGAVHASEVVATAASVVGVVGIDLDRLYRGFPFPPRRERLVAAPATMAGSVPLGAELLALSTDPLDWLLELS
ncbi:putative baseplate assembly protein [Agromyces sp. ZXT2-3]|uniref:putative baseplate assembly protein n=1 Tax=Agromyces sp. ZXT2-3 TaxID=3461152 RepID=UPI004054BFBC